MGKVYTIEVGVEFPFVGGDDTFKVNVEFTDKEMDEIIQGGIRLMHKDSMDIGSYEFIEVLSKSAYNKLNAIAEKVATEKWGDKMLIANSARYNYFLPDDISNAIFDSPEVNEIKNRRNKKEKDLEAYTKEVLYHPICPSDMLLSGKVNPFPVAEAIAHRERLKAEGGRGTKCYLTQNPETGEIEIQLSNNQLPDYPWKGGFIDAPVVLYEPLPKEKPADNLYVSSLDDYKQDEAGTDSVGSFHIYKVDVGMDKNCGKIVESLATRPDPHGKFHRQIYLLQQAFNARCLMENADMDYKTYLEGKRVADIWLQETLDFDSDMTRQGTNRRKYGWTPTPKNKKNLLSQFINYCKREFTTYNEDGDEITVLGVERIDDIGLLDEIIAYSEDNNVDRITSAMGCLGFESYLSANYLLPNFNKNLIERRESNRRTNNNIYLEIFINSYIFN